MHYHLILDHGAVLKFHIRACAEIYQRVWGGRILTVSVAEKSALYTSC
jgi:hypothetical protein